MTRKPITVEQVERIYRAVYECLDRCESVHGLWGAVYADDDVRGSAKGPPGTVERVALVVDGMRGLKAQHEKLVEAVKAFDWELPGLLGGAVRNSGVTEASWTAGVLGLAKKLTDGLDKWERLTELKAKERRDLVNGFFHLSTEFTKPPDFSLFRANVQIEASKMRERARAWSPEVRYEYEFLHLKPQSRRLFRYFSENPGRRIEYQEMADPVFGNPHAKDGQIQSAVFRLRRELEAMGSKKVAEAIATEDGAYRFE